MHISKLFSHVNPFSSQPTKTNPSINFKQNIHTQTSNTNFGRVSPFSTTAVKGANMAKPSFVSCLSSYLPLHGIPMWQAFKLKGKVKRNGQHTCPPIEMPVRPRGPNPWLWHQCRRAMDSRIRAPPITNRSLTLWRLERLHRQSADDSTDTAIPVSQRNSALTLQYQTVSTIQH